MHRFNPFHSYLFNYKEPAQVHGVYHIKQTKNPVPSYVWEAITRRDSLCPCKTNKQVLEARNWLSQSHKSNS